MAKDLIILVVDDNPTNLKVLSETLSDSGWKILVANDGEMAIDQAEYAQPDLILLDVMMPGLDGFEVCKRLQAMPSLRETPIIFMTALNDKESRVKGLSLGAVDYITKPFWIEEVLARINVHLKIRVLTQQLKQQSSELEERVQTRTAELSQALDDLQTSQFQIMQSEKMSALGQLVAGVAHEINNPLNFIGGNLRYAEEYVEDIVKYIELVDQVPQELHQQASAFAREVGLGESIADFPALLSSMRVGVDRISEISNSLRRFARSGDEAKEFIDLHENLETTLLILKPRLKATTRRLAIEVVKEYELQDLMECYPGPLSQALMNLLANAIDAIDEAAELRSPEERQFAVSHIFIRTRDRGDGWAEITIRDEGVGMTEETQARIFESLFTTKVVGKGTGLGLSITRQIVEEKHRGQLSFSSKRGEGSEFVVAIPLLSE